MKPCIVHACDDREYVVALVSLGLCRVFVRIEDDADCIKVVDLLELDAFLGHLVPYRIWSLHPLLDLISETGLLKSLVDLSFMWIKPRKAITNLDSILKSRDITLPKKVCLVKAMVFPVVMYGM